MISFLYIYIYVILVKKIFSWKISKNLLDLNFKLNKFHKCNKKWEICVENVKIRNKIIKLNENFLKNVCTITTITFYINIKVLKREMKLHFSITN